MVVGEHPRRRRSQALTPALIVPDELAWTMWGRDPRGSGFAAAPGPEAARQLILPERVPEPVASATAEAFVRMPPPRRYSVWPAGVGGVPADELFGDATGEGGHSDASHGHDGREGDHGGHDEHDARARGEHDHHDMMAIVGEASADGLVMEAIEFELGPLASGFPGGLVIELSLDGDVVERCEPRATLETSPEHRMRGAAPDPLAPSAWAMSVALARQRAAGAPPAEAALRLWIAALESERALSHAAWLRAFGLVLGWERLVELAQSGITALMRPRAVLLGAAASSRLADGARADVVSMLDTALPAVERLSSGMTGSRSLRARTAGRASVSWEQVQGARLGGPAARAAGIEHDARLGDPLYEALGYQPELEADGDAHARTLVRAREARASVELARDAVVEIGEEASATERHEAASAVTVEGPRGPLRALAVDGDGGASGGLEVLVASPGSRELLELAGASVVDLELGTALAGIASFDLSPWTVAP